jgi:GTP cyclohydrolase I
MSCRGAKAEGATTVTSKVYGAFKNEAETRKEFFDLIKQ